MNYRQYIQSIISKMSVGDTLAVDVQGKSKGVIRVTIDRCKGDMVFKTLIGIDGEFLVKRVK